MSDIGGKFTETSETSALHTRPAFGGAVGQGAQTAKSDLTVFRSVDDGISCPVHTVLPSPEPPASPPQLTRRLVRHRD